MTVPLKVPSVGESIQEVQIAQWLKQDGDWVEQDEDVVEIDTDKASLCIAAPVTGRITNIQKRDGDATMVGDVIAEIDDAVKREPDETAKQRVAISHTASDDGVEVPAVSTSQPADDDVRTAASAEAAVAAELRTPTDATSKDRQVERRDGQRIPPAQNVTVEREEELVPMSMIRRRIATRLVEAQQKGALLTTFNEIEMSAVIKLRSDLRKPFQERYGVKLGFMSFFVKAAIEALRVFPEANAEVRGDQIVYHKYCDIGVAIGAGKGLVVPVLRNAERLSFAEIESTIDDFAIRAQNNKLGPKELIGGTFTISNGGVYGSLLSTPIINPPQSGVLGMHAIQDRPVASDGIVVIRPMMYVALTYDHRIVDGREAVGFLRRIKDLVEEPARILLEV